MVTCSISMFIIQITFLFNDSWQSLLKLIQYQYLVFPFFSFFFSLRSSSFIRITKLKSVIRILHIRYRKEVNVILKISIQAQGVRLKFSAWKILYCVEKMLGENPRVERKDKYAGDGKIFLRGVTSNQINNYFSVSTSSLYVYSTTNPLVQ